MPLALTSFIGREQEVATIQALLRETRLLTLTGAGGCGKTRLGLRVARERLSVFAGGWTLEAAEAVGAGEGVEAREVLDLLASLVRKSLVLLEERQARGDIVVRYRLLDTVRQYSQERLLASGTAGAVRTRFREWCLALAARAELGIEGAEQRVWSNLIEAELDNLRSVLAQGITGADATDAALRLVTALRWFWPLYDHVDEGRWWLKVLSVLGNDAHGQSDYPGAVAFWEEAQALVRELCIAYALSTSQTAIRTVRHAPPSCSCTARFM